MTFTVIVLKGISGAPPLEGATVNAVNQTTGVTYTGTTNSLGQTLINAPDGPYVLTVSADGYDTKVTGRINFGDGGGYILALTPTAQPPPPPPAGDLKKIMVTTVIPIIVGGLSIKVAR